MPAASFETAVNEHVKTWRFEAGIDNLQRRWFDRCPAPSAASLIQALTTLGVPPDVANAYLGCVS
jgi:hypothetical protein